MNFCNLNIPVLVSNWKTENSQNSRKPHSYSFLVTDCTVRLPLTRITPLLTSDSIYLFYVCVCVCVCSFFSRATPVAYRSSQARGWIGGAASNLHHSHSNSGSELWPTPQHHSSWQHQILNSLREGRGPICIFMDTNCVPDCGATTGTPCFACFCTLHKCDRTIHKTQLFTEFSEIPQYTENCWDTWGKSLWLTCLSVVTHHSLGPGVGDLMSEEKYWLLG